MNQPTHDSSTRLTHQTVGPAMVIAVILVVAIYRLRHQGRIWWCVCGKPYLWVSDVHSAHNSQHLFDAYSFTHILHGVLLCGLLTVALPRIPALWRLGLTISIEALWEVVENSALIINRYRANTVSLGYEGDSIANSLGDILSCALGFLIARKVGWRSSFLLVIVIELALLVWIKDSLLLNIIMLVYPIESVKAWQIAD